MDDRKVYINEIERVVLNICLIMYLLLIFNICESVVSNIRLKYRNMFV